MSFNTDDDEVFRPVTRLSKGFALRDLIAGAEFEIREDSCQDVDEEEHFKGSKYSVEEVEDYINLSALDLEADDVNNIISFPELRKQMSPITSDGKVMKLIKRPGAGNCVKKDSVVYVHYSAYANLDEIPFDNSYLRRKRPERLQLGAGSILVGLELALRTMKKGEKSQFLIEPEYAFGDKGCPPRIPPEATVLYEVELFNFTDVAPADQPESLSNEDKHSFSYISKIAKSCHVSGNDLFRQKNEKAAIVKYKKAVDLLLDCRLKDAEEEAEQKKLLLKLYTNLSVCYMKIKRPERVCIVVKEAMYVNEENARKNAKLLFNWGSALSLLGEYKRAAEHLRAALKLEPNNGAIKDEISKLERKKSQYAEQEKISFQKAFGYKPVKTETVQTVNNADDDINAELKELIKMKIEDAKSGKPVRINFMPEVIDKVEELCKSFITEADSLFVEQVRGALVISKVGDSK